MTRKIAALVLILALISLAVPVGAAKASPGEEKEIVIKTLHVPHYDTWLHSDGVTWTAKAPGQVASDYKVDILPKAISDKYIVARDPEVTTEITPELYAQTLSPDLQQRGWWGNSWKDFYDQVYRYRPLEYYEARVVARLGDPNSQAVLINFTFKLSPYAPRAGQYATPPRFPDGLSYAYPVDLRTEQELNGQHFEPNVEGWRWKLPVVVTWYLKERPKPPDLYVKSLDPGTSEVEEGKRYTGTVVFGLKSTVSGPVQAKLELTHNGYSVSGVNGQTVTFNPGEEKTFSFNFTGQSQDSVLETKIRPVSGRDADWSDNSKRVTVPLARRQEPSGPGSLTFQAVSVNRDRTRPANTAKWSDWVTATLRPPEPVPPIGRLVSWRIVSASLTYPKKHPQFSFGTPYPPQGTRTVAMTPKGHEATVEFQEDWGMDGAGIYSLLEKRLMAEEPRYYTLTADYTVEFTYEWEEEVTDCSTDPTTGEESCGSYTITRSATDTISGTVSGRLLVNGTGVNILSQ